MSVNEKQHKIYKIFLFVCLFFKDRISYKSRLVLNSLCGRMALHYWSSCLHIPTTEITDCVRKSHLSFTEGKHKYAQGRVVRFYLILSFLFPPSFGFKGQT